MKMSKGDDAMRVVPVRQELSCICNNDRIRKHGDVRQQFDDVRPTTDVLGVLRPRSSADHRDVPGVDPNLGVGVDER